MNLVRHILCRLCGMVCVVVSLSHCGGGSSPSGGGIITPVGLLATQNQDGGTSYLTGDVFPLARSMSQRMGVFAEFGHGMDDNGYALSLINAGAAYAPTAMLLEGGQAGFPIAHPRRPGATITPYPDPRRTDPLLGRPPYPENIEDMFLFQRYVSGYGVTLGIWDTPLFLDNKELEDKKIRYFNAATTRDPHGTQVAALMAGTFHDDGLGGVMGVAFDADIISVGAGIARSVPRMTRVFTTLSQLGGFDRCETGIGGTCAHAVIDLFTGKANSAIRADVVNASFGIPGLIDHYSQTEVENSIPRILAALKQDTSSTRKTIFVFAAGNSNNISPATSPEFLAGLPLLIPELEGHMVAVVAVDKDRKIAGFSNRCGMGSAHYCIAAPGVDVRLTNGADRGQTTTTGSGTSFAAPLVTGALALLIERFGDQGLSAQQLVRRMLRTADKNFDSDPTSNSDDTDDLDIDMMTDSPEEIMRKQTFNAGNDNDYEETIHGAGILDIAASLVPHQDIGDRYKRGPFGRFIIGGRTFEDAESAPVMTTRLSLPPSAGDALAAFGPRALTFFDDLDTAFLLRSDYIIASPPSPSFAQHVETIFDSFRQKSKKTTMPLSPHAVGISPTTLTMHVAPAVYGGAHRQPSTDFMLSLESRKAHFTISHGPSLDSNSVFHGTRHLLPSSLGDHHAFTNPYMMLASQGLDSRPRGKSIGLSQHYKTPYGTMGMTLNLHRYEAERHAAAPTSPSRPWSGVLHYSPSQPFAFHIGVVEEKETLLASYGTGALAMTPEKTLFMGMQQEYRFSPRVSLISQGFIGRSTARPQQASMLSHITPIISTRFDSALHIQEMFSRHDALLLHIQQPLHIESGRAVIHYAHWRNAHGPLYRHVALPLTPHAREIRLGIGYQRRNAHHHLSLRTDYTLNPNHQQQNKNAVRVLLSMKKTF
ncbi:MAG: S8 family serine peptidase [Alphaproteobacteria bacterium GM7ARS4]|nr:S8 family serine peptidase [Alphaproteobacteria bacterium GM7ARS4]